MRAVRAGSRALFVLGLLLLGVPEAFSQDTEKSVVLCAFAPARPSGADAALEEILERFVTVELARAGLPARTVDADDPAALVRRAAEDGVPFTLSGVYDQTAKRVGLSLAWYDVATGSALAEVSGEGELDLDFDGVVAALVREILAATGARRERPEPESESRDPVPAGPVAPAPAAPEPIRGEGFTVSGGFAPFLVNGKASEYFKYGLLSNVFAGYGFALGTGVLAAGINASYGWFFAEGELEDTRVRVVPVDAEVRYELRGVLPVGLLTRVAAGPSILSFDPGEGPRRSKTVLHLSAGLGVAVPLTRMLEIRVETAYTVIFEEVYPIMGFTPFLSAAMLF